MTICDGKVVSIEYTLTFGGEEVVDTNVGMEPLVFKQGEHQVIAGLERELEGMAAGESRQIVLAPDDAYGPVVPEAVVTAPLAQLPEEIQKEGTMVQGKGSDGQTITGQVKKIDGDEATIDFNHPMAGRTLYFEIKILSVE